MTSGDRLSMTSAGTPATPLGKPTALRPSLVGRAPVPPTWNTVRLNAGSWPRHTLSQMGSALGAMSLPGSALASAVNTAVGTKWPTVCRAATGAGSLAFRMLPAGALTCTGRKLPSLCGTSG